MAVPDAPTEVPTGAEEPSVRLLDHGAASTTEARSRPRGVVVAAALVVAALVVGFLLGTGSVLESPEPSTRLGVAAETNGLATAIDGLEDTLLVVATNGSRAMDIVMWPPRGALSTRPAPIAWAAVTVDGLPFGDFASFDASGRYIALAAPVASEASAVLMAGRLEEQVVVATGVTGHAWHQTEPHQLAVAIEEDGKTTLHVMLGAPMSLSPVGELPDGARLVAWLQGGYLIRLGGELEGVLAFAGGGGGFEGELIGADAHGLMLAIDEGVSVMDETFRPEQAWYVAYDGTVAAREPDTGRIAIGGPQGMLVVTADGDRIAGLEHPFVERLDWSSDGRFIVFADRVDVFVFDLETGEVRATGLGPSEAVMFRPPVG